jgi:hypothetical protein
MSPISMIACSLALASTLAVVSMLLLRRPLYSLLVEVCGNERRASFWQVMASLSIVLMTLFGVLLSLPSNERNLWADYPGGREVLQGLRTGVFGLLVALGALSFTLLLAINSFERNSRRHGTDPSWMRVQGPPAS